MMPFWREGGDWALLPRATSWLGPTRPSGSGVRRRSLRHTLQPTRWVKSKWWLFHGKRVTGLFCQGQRLGQCCWWNGQVGQKLVSVDVHSNAHCKLPGELHFGDGFLVGGGWLGLLPWATSWSALLEGQQDNHNQVSGHGYPHTHCPLQGKLWLLTGLYDKDSVLVSITLGADKSIRMLGLKTVTLKDVATFKGSLWFFLPFPGWHPWPELWESGLIRGPPDHVVHVQGSGQHHHLWLQGGAGHVGHQEGELPGDGCGWFHKVSTHFCHN